jgi:DNA polymerase-1
VLSRNPATRALGERYAINTVVQGSAADLIKIAMIDIHKTLPHAEVGGARMILQIHDELVFESPRSVADGAMQFVRERMQRAMTLKVPLVVEAAWNENWIDAK